MKDKLNNKRYVKKFIIVVLIILYLMTTLGISKVAGAEVALFANGTDYSIITNESPEIIENKIIGINPEVTYEDTSIYVENGRTSPLTLTIEDLNIEAPVGDSFRRPTVLI